MADMQCIYDLVLEHYYNCDVDNANINEVWSNTLATKGRVYSTEQLTDALSPGSVVRADIFDFNRYVDPTAIDLLDPVTSRLVEIGESEFGNSLKDVNLAGKRFSSKYLSNVAQASDIIALLESRGVHSPRIMEIGGGVGLLLQALRKHYGGRATLFAVDLPETLFIQEWLLRNWFPGSEFACKGTSAPVSMVDGGINLINAYVVSSQDVPVDIVININSFQEMEKDTCDAYCDYAARNLSKMGVLYLENHFGHGDGSFSEPTELSLGEGFTTLSADVRYQTDTLNAYESLRLVLGRTSQREDTQTRRFVHRLLWNGFNAGRLPRNTGVMEELLGLPQSVAYGDCVDTACAILEKHRVELDRSWLENLRTSPYFDGGPSFRSHAESAPVTSRPAQSTQGFMAEMWAAQSRLNSLMHEVVSSPGEERLDLVSGKLRSICQGLVQAVADPEVSEVKSANLACFLLPLGGRELGREILVKAAERSQQSYWLVRLAQLLAYFGYDGEAAQALSRIDNVCDLNPIVQAHVAAITHSLGQVGEGEKVIGRLLRSAEGLSPVETAAVARAGAKINDPELAAEALSKMVSIAEDGRMREVLEVLQFSLLCFPSEPGKSLVHTFLDRIRPYIEQPQSRLVVGTLRHQLGEGSVASGLIDESLHDLPGGFYSLGWAGSVLMRAGLDEIADRCLRKTLELRPRNFTHCEYVGNIYLGAGNWPAASEIYGTALTAVPHARSVRARKLYCDLPEKFKRANTFSDPFGLSMVFQETQDFYSDIVPSLKPRVRLVNPVLAARPPVSESVPG
jgi:putative sugar O-methyltransferase